MAFDPKVHDIDPATGFQVDKDTGHPTGLVGKPHLPVTEERDWPKWVVVHEGHVVRKKGDGGPEHVSVPGFAEFHVNRVGGAVMVLVKDADEEHRAVTAPGDVAAAEGSTEHGV